MTAPSDVRRGVPLWGLRVAVAVVVLGLGADLLAHTAAPALLVVGALLGAACVFAPASPAPLLLIALVAVVLTVSGDDPLRPGVLVAIPLAHALHLLCAITALVPRGARIEARSLRAPSRRAVGVQMIIFAVAGMAAAVPDGPGTPFAELAGLLSIAAITLVVISAHRRGG